MLTKLLLLGTSAAREIRSAKRKGSINGNESKGEQPSSLFSTCFTSQISGKAATINKAHARERVTRLFKGLFTVFFHIYLPILITPSTIIILQ